MAAMDGQFAGWVTNGNGYKRHGDWDEMLETEMMIQIQNVHGAN